MCVPVCFHIFKSSSSVRLTLWNSQCHLSLTDCFTLSFMVFSDKTQDQQFDWRFWRCLRVSSAPILCCIGLVMFASDFHRPFIIALSSCDGCFFRIYRVLCILIFNENLPLLCLFTWHGRWCWVEMNIHVCLSLFLGMTPLDKLAHLSANWIQLWRIMSTLIPRRRCR